MDYCGNSSVKRDISTKPLVIYPYYYYFLNLQFFLKDIFTFLTIYFSIFQQKIKFTFKKHDFSMAFGFCQKNIYFEKAY